MKKIFAICLLLLAFAPTQNVFAQEEIKVEYNGTPIMFNEKSIAINNRTLVQLRPIAEALDLGIEYTLDSGHVILSNADCVVTFQQNSDIIDVNGIEMKMDVPMIIHNNYSFVPVRNLVEPFGNEIVYNGETKVITITPKTINEEFTFNEEWYEESLEETYEPKEYIMPFYYQAQPEFEFENNGRGYCWVCSYAMLFSCSSGEEITPVDVAGYNIESGFVGNFMAPHELLVRNFGLELVPALSEDSQYFGGFNLKGRGETSLIVETDEDVVAAISEALQNFPAGILVRYDGYPHTMVAVAVDGGKIYFNDPAVRNGERILFEETCLKKFKLSDISFIQAVK